MGVGDGKVARVWREHGIQPWRVETFNFSTDPELVAKVTDIVGLYLDPPENATVLCVDEKSHIPGIGSRRGDLADAKGPDLYPIYDSLVAGVLNTLLTI